MLLKNIINLVLYAMKMRGSETLAALPAFVKGVVRKYRSRVSIRAHATMTSRIYVTHARVRKELYCSMASSFSTDSDEVEETEVGRLYTNCKDTHTISIIY